MLWQPESSGYGKCSKNPQFVVCPRRGPRLSPTTPSCVPNEDVVCPRREIGHSDKGGELSTFRLIYQQKRQCFGGFQPS